MGLRYRIYKTVQFEAAHRLEGLGPDHKCSRPHGHSYKVSFTLEGSTLDDNGILLDYDLLFAVVTDRYDHRDLNVVMKVNPTSENLAREIFEVLSQVLFQMGYVQDVKIRRIDVEEGAGGGCASVLCD